MKQTLPFEITKEDNFFDRLGDWIGDVFYDELPEKGFEVRDEQIYTAFQLEKAFRQKEVMFAEAGVGTGKTFIYLLYSICYARYTGKPAIIACADENLIEQLVKKSGDIKKLEDALGLSVDVRLAKSRSQYLCLKKLDTAMLDDRDEAALDVFQELPPFVYQSNSMQKFERYGDRKDYPELTEEQWQRMSWDSLQNCLSCDLRHRCAQTLHREHYRQSTDLIICSHDFYMEHVWSKESRKREGQLPLLPEASCVIFDEGHLLEDACQKALTYKITAETLEKVLTQFSQSEVREETLYLIEEVLESNFVFFDSLQASLTPVAGSNRYHIEKNAENMMLAKKLQKKMEGLLDQLVFEGELFTIEAYDLHIMEEYLEQYLYSLKLFIEEQRGVIWFEKTLAEQTLVIMPRLVEEILKEKVFSNKIPYIFSSATLSTEENFDFISRSLGIEKFISSSVASPFDYEANMQLSVQAEDSQNEKFRSVCNDLLASDGKSLLLFQNKEEMHQFKQYLRDEQVSFSFSMFFEGEKEMSHLIQAFQEQTTSVLCAYQLWEGLDIPGESLSHVHVINLPFPPQDPVYEAKRKNSADAFRDIDVPMMLLKLRQGIGRLIRTSEDSGSVRIWITSPEQALVYDDIVNVLPTSLS